VEKDRNAWQMMREFRQESGRKLRFMIWLADRTATGIIMSSVCLSVTLCIVALRGSVYRAKSCTNVFLVGKFILVPSDTFAVCISFSHKVHREKNGSK